MNAKQKMIAKLSAVAFIVVVGGYYVMKLRSGGERAASFVSLTYQWGMGDTLQNSYNSKTGEYLFLGQRDQLIKENFKLRTNNIIFLHSKINQEDLLNIPDTIANVGANLKDPKVLRYEFSFEYADTAKKVIYLTNYDKDPVIANKAKNLQQAIQQVITEAEERFARR